MINIIKKKLAEELIKYDLKLVDFLPGVLLVEVLKYEERKEEILNLIENIRKDESVTSVTYDNYNVKINFNNSDIFKPVTLKRWKEIFKDYV